MRLTLRAYAPEIDYDVLTRQALGRRVVRTAPAESLLLLKPTGAVEHGGGVRFDTDSLEYRVISEWIAAGTPPPAAHDPKVVALKAYPDAVRLKPGETQQILVQAVFSDGRVEDVTRWAKFSSTDDTVAKVDESGRVRVEGHGEATVADPLREPGPARDRDRPRTRRRSTRRSSATRPARTRSTTKNLAKLEALRIPPSPDAGDAAFLRRAYLDATGTLPPADAGRAVPGRQATRTSGRSWSTGCWRAPNTSITGRTSGRTCLLVSSNKLPAPAMWSFYRFVRQSVAENVPWDRFARAVVTAKGDTLSNGAANYFVLHRDPIDLTESASMAFLGLSLTCARCHNHPMEKWTQDQYYGMASLFSRVQLKDGGAPGDVVVMPAAEGEIRHPRTGAVMPPQPLDAAAVATESRADRREAFADWLARPENPYFARAAVNRVWRNFFGRGLIDPEDDLRATNPASDEPLMDWLVADFRAHGYDVKHLIRTIMNSAVYARSSVPVAGRHAADAKFLSHYPVKRLPAEVLLDAIARVTDVPTTLPRLPGRLAEPATPRFQGRERLPDLVRPSRAVEHLFVRAVVRALDGPGAPPRQRRDGQREAPRPQRRRRQGDRREGDRRRDPRPPLPRRPDPQADRRRDGRGS